MQPACSVKDPCFPPGWGSQCGSHPPVTAERWRLSLPGHSAKCPFTSFPAPQGFVACWPWALLLMAAITRFGVPTNGRTYTRQAFIEAVFADSGFKITASDVTRYIALEANIQAQITGRLRDEFLDWSPADLLMMQSIQSSVSEQLAELNRLHTVGEAQRAELDGCREVIESQRTELQMIHKSRSWKITAPLRRLSRALRGGKSTATESQD
mgnify:CR=1 FL=1